MKLLVLFFCTFIFITAKSQQAPPTLAMNNSKYKFLFETEKGKVFESPVDHMRCLAPKFSSKTPVAGSNIHKVEPMPNGAKDGLLPPPLTKEK